MEIYETLGQKGIKYHISRKQKDNWMLKENIRNFSETVNFLCDNVWSENFRFYHITCLPRQM